MTHPTPLAPTMPFSDLERVYEALAVAIDAAGKDNEPVLLAKIVLMLAHKSSDADTVLACIAVCASPAPAPQ